MPSKEKKATPKKKDETKPKVVKAIPAPVAKKIYKVRGYAKACETAVAVAKEVLKDAKENLEARQRELGELLDEAESGQGNLFEK